MLEDRLQVSYAQNNDYGAIYNDGFSGRFSGYASLFDKPDQSGDIVKRGAFEKILSQKPLHHIPMLAHHDPERPIGRWEVMKEDAKGLFVIGVLNQEVKLARELLSLMVQGVMTGLSIGYRNIASTPARNRRAHPSQKVNSQYRYLKQLDLWEVSLVTFPMLEEARIHSIEKVFEGQEAKKSQKNLCPPLSVDAKYLRRSLKIFK